MTVISYCCVCHNDTPHVVIYDDPFFYMGLQCPDCGIVWEADAETVLANIEENENG